MKTIWSFTQNTIHQLKNLSSFLILNYLIVFIILMAIAIIGNYFNIPLSKFTRDPIHLLNGHPLTGVISNIGILFWCSTVAICFFSSAVCWMNKKVLNPKFLFYSGLITLMLLLDDLFMFHEIIYPKYFHIPEIIVYLIYLTLIASYLLKFRKDILDTEYVLLLLALSFFALSILMDVFITENELVFLFEDGFKLFGIVSWFLFFVRTCFNQFLEILKSKHDLKLNQIYGIKEELTEVEIEN
ncbi:hypothetical protein [Marinifilum fragile]|uniref:hypothetical protein n=1 Tax=Marinifilum fragile TaxID=570161 RepID=UPI000AC25B77|nr:hypothetical protein [Marinifilum fragile]